MAKQFQYENHYEMKQNRLKVLEKADYTCAICGGKAEIVHHVDGSKNNHDPENLMPLCTKCHGKVHKKNNKNVIRWDSNMINVAMALKGLDKGELAKAVGVSVACITNLLKTGKTKNSTMRKIAAVLNYPLEAFLSEEYAQLYDELQEKINNVSPLKIAVYEKLSPFAHDKAKHKLYHIWLTNSLREKFGVKSYFLIPPEKQAEAIDFINNWNLQSQTTA